MASRQGLADCLLPGSKRVRPRPACCVPARALAEGCPAPCHLAVPVPVPTGAFPGLAHCRWSACLPSMESLLSRRLMGAVGWKPRLCLRTEACSERIFAVHGSAPDCHPKNRLQRLGCTERFCTALLLHAPVALLCNQKKKSSTRAVHAAFVYGGGCAAMTRGMFFKPLLTLDLFCASIQHYNISFKSGTPGSATRSTNRKASWLSTTKHAVEESAGRQNGGAVLA